MVLTMQLRGLRARQLAVLHFFVNAAILILETIVHLIAAWMRYRVSRYSPETDAPGPQPTGAAWNFVTNCKSFETPEALERHIIVSRGHRTPHPMSAARALLTSLCLLLSATAAAAEQHVKLAGLDVTVWSDAAVANERQPVLLFSHGFRGCATQSRFLMEAFARAGYIVFAPNHRDASCGRGNRPEKPNASFRTPEAWTDAVFRDRADDLRRLRDAIGADERFASRADLGRVGLVGHSLGGYTVLGMAGAWPAWKLEGFRAVLALSPYSQPFVVQRTLGGLSVPVMYQGGTRDVGITPAIHKTRGAYEQSPAPKYFVDFEGATHFAWTNVGLVARQSIVDYSVAFLDRYVKGAPSAPILTEKRADVAVLRYATAENADALR